MASGGQWCSVVGGLAESCCGFAVVRCNLAVLRRVADYFSGLQWAAVGYRGGWSASGPHRAGYGLCPTENGAAMRCVCLCRDRDTEPVPPRYLILK